MISILKSFKQSLFPSYLGIDIGTTSIKAVEVKPGKELPEVVNYGILESSGHLVRVNQALQTSTVKLFEKEMIKLLQLLMEKMRPGSREVLASIPIFSAFTTLLYFPKMPAKELAESLVFQAKQYVPLPLSEVALDWIKVGEYEDDKGFWHQQVLLVSVPQEQIRKYQNLFRAVGLNLKVLEVESLSLTRILANDPTPTVVVDIGSRSTNIAFIEKGQFKFSAQTDFGGASLTQALSSSLGINPLRAEELKKECGLSTEGPNYELSTIMLPFLDAIINEIRKAMHQYEVQLRGAAKIERVVLAGGGANLRGVEGYFEKELGVPTAKSAPFLRFERPAEMEPFIAELSPALSVALGLTLGEFT